MIVFIFFQFSIYILRLLQVEHLTRFLALSRCEKFFFGGGEVTKFLGCRFPPPPKKKDLQEMVVELHVLYTKNLLKVLYFVIII